MTLSKLLKEQGVQAVPYGFRSSFRDWEAEETNHPRDAVEAAPAHRLKDPQRPGRSRVRAIHALERRRRLMADWEAYLAATSVASTTTSPPPSSAVDQRPGARRAPGVDCAPPSGRLRGLESEPSGTRPGRAQSA